jgi:hypothetical protein
MDEFLERLALVGGLLALIGISWGIAVAIIGAPAEVFQPALVIGGIGLLINLAASVLNK